MTKQERKDEARAWHLRHIGGLAASRRESERLVVLLTKQIEDACQMHEIDIAAIEADDA